MADERLSSISKARSLEEMAAFWDTHSLADYEGEIREVKVTFDASARRTYVGIDPELMADLRRIAKQRRISTQTLINLWLRQRVDQLLQSIASS